MISKLKAALLAAGVLTAFQLSAAGMANASPAALEPTNSIEQVAADMGFAIDESTGAIKVSAIDGPASRSLTTSLKDGSATVPLVEGPDQSRLVVNGGSNQAFLVDETGSLLGAYEITSIRSDTDGSLIPGSFESQGEGLLVVADQSFGDATVAIQFVGNDIAEDSDSYRESIIEVPGEYQYDPSRGSLHDYCTSSPDEFPNPFGANAPFHGPCARHDLCIERAGFHDHGCDGPLRDDMKNNCRATYGPGVTRTSCEATAEVYWGAVTVASYF